MPKDKEQIFHIETGELRNGPLSYYLHNCSSGAPRVYMPVFSSAPDWLGKQITVEGICIMLDVVRIDSRDTLLPRKTFGLHAGLAVLGDWQY